MSYHTPGPWKLSVTDGYAYVKGPNRAFILQYTLDVQQVGGWRKSKEEREFIVDQRIANARLIAAAPMLLDALRELLRDTQHADHACGDEQCPVTRARRAIAAATGEETPA